MLTSVFVKSSLLRPATTRASLSRRVTARSLVAGVAALIALGAPSLASAQTTTFETLGYAGACQAGGSSHFSTLDGKSWAGFRTLDLANYRTTCGYGTANGYGMLGSTVGNVIGLGAGTAYVNSTNPFVLNSMVAGAGWQNPTSLKLEFYLNTVLLDTKIIQLTTYQTGLSLYSGFYTGATDFIMFTPTYPPDDAAHTSDVFGSRLNYCPVGSPTTCVFNRYESWFVDNLTFSTPAVTVAVVTPEPATVGMIGLGLVLVGLVGRKRLKA